MYGALMEVGTTSANIPLVVSNTATTSNNNLLSFSTDTAGTQRGVFRYDRTGDRLNLIGNGGGLLFTGASTFSSSLTASNNLTIAGSIYGRTTSGYPSTSLGYYAIKTNNIDAERGGITLQVSNSTSTFIDALTINYTGAATFSSTATIKGIVVVGASGGYTTGGNTYVNFGGGATPDTFGAINAPFGDKMKFNSYHGFQFKTSNSGSSPVTMFEISIAGIATFASLGTGTVQATSGTLSTISDMNFKNEDGFIDNALEKVMNLKPRYYHWKEESGLPTDIRQLGFYAQEVNEALGEEAANTPKTENDKWGIYDRGMIAFLTKAIQEQQAQIEELKALIAAK